MNKIKAIFTAALMAASMGVVQAETYDLDFSLESDVFGFEMMEADFDLDETVQDYANIVGLTANQAHTIADEIDSALGGNTGLGGTIGVGDLINISLNDMDNVGTANFDGIQVGLTYVSTEFRAFEDGEQVGTDKIKQEGITIAVPVFEDEDTTVSIIGGITRVTASTDWADSKGSASASLMTIGASVTEKLSEDTSVSLAYTNTAGMGIVGASITHYEDLGDVRIGVKAGISANLVTGNKVIGLGMLSIEEKGETGFFVSPTSVGLIAHDDKGQRYELTLNPIGVVMNLAAGNPTVFDFVGDNEADWAINKK